MGLKKRTTGWQPPKFESWQHEEAAKRCDEWREIIRRRDSLVEFIERDRTAHHEDHWEEAPHPHSRAKSSLERLDSALVALQWVGKSHVANALAPDKYAWTAEEVNAVERLLLVFESQAIGCDRLIDAEWKQEELEFTALICGFSCGAIHTAINDERVRKLKTGKSTRKAAIMAVAILRGVSPSKVYRHTQETSW